MTLGIFDDVVYGKNIEDDILRKSYGFDKLWEDISPLRELPPDHWYAKGEDAFDVLIEALAQSKFSFPSLELDLASAIRYPRSDLDDCLHLAVIGEDGMIPRDLNICIKAGLDWTFRFFHRDVDHDGLVFDFEGPRHAQKRRLILTSSPESLVCSHQSLATITARALVLSTHAVCLAASILHLAPGR